MARKDKSRPLSTSNAVPKTKLIPSVSALNPGQKSLIKAISNPDNSIVFCSGIAGSGKTFCSVSWGVEQFFKGKFSKLIFTRPVVEAGESLGFLPGDMSSKLSVYMIPIFDSLGDQISLSDIKKLVEEEKIITLPLAYMRGCTFKNSFVLLDEAQNTSAKQMHLFLTRIGQGSKVVITGDKSQSDLGPDNGFSDALTRLFDPKDPIEGLEHVELDPNSVVRHKIIPAIDKRYVK